MKKLLLGLALALGIAIPASGVVQTTLMPNANYSALTTDVRIVTGPALTAARTITLPAVGGTCIGQTCPANALEFYDQAGQVSATNTITLTPQSGDTINGSSASMVISGPYTRVILVPIASNNWDATVTGNIQTASLIGSASGGVALTSNVAANILSLVAVNPGIWDCNASLAAWPAATAVVSTFSAWLSSTSATSVAAGNVDFAGRSSWWGPTVGITNPANLELNVGPMRFQLTAATTIFAEVLSNFITAQESAYGYLRCAQVK